MQIFREKKYRDITGNEPGVYLFDDDVENAWILNQDGTYVMGIPKMLGEEVIRLSELVNSLATLDEDKQGNPDDVRVIKRFGRYIVVDVNGNEITNSEYLSDKSGETIVAQKVTLPENFYTEPGLGTRVNQTNKLIELKKAGFTSSEIVEMAAAGLLS